MSKLEDILKEALDNHDMGYQQGAWEQIQLRLDGTPATPFYKKWWFAASIGTVLVGSATFFSLQEKQQLQSVQHTVANHKAIDKFEPTENHKSTDFQTTSSTAGHSNGLTEDNTFSQKNSTSVELSSFEEHISSLNTNPEDETTPQYSFHPKTNMVPAEVQISTQKIVCLNSEFSVHFTNLDKNTPVYVNGRPTTVGENGILVLKAKEIGNTEIKAGNSSVNVKVIEGKTANIELVDSYLYEKGVPTLKFKVAGDADHLLWNSNTKGSEMVGDTYVVHAYNERMVSVELKAQDANGCTFTDKTSITIQEPYQLLAPTGFRPLDYDPKVKTFMPYALQVRETGFVLMIIDPSTNAVIYSTKDANLGWDGIDPRSNQLVAEGSSWIWKVVLEKPNPGEPKEYTGIITRK